MDPRPLVGLGPRGVGAASEALGPFARDLEAGVMDAGSGGWCWCVIVLQVVGTLAAIALIGKPRKPVTAAQAITVTILNTLIVISILAFWDW